MSNAAASLVNYPALTRGGRWLVLVTAFLGWMFAGVQMSITQLIGQSAAVDLLSRSGQLDTTQFLELNKRAQNSGTTQDGQTIAPLSSSEKAQLAGWKSLAAQWFAWYQCAFLIGAATGGLVFGRFGDRFGRTQGMAASIATYSALAIPAYFATNPWQLLVLWFVGSLGVGGIWPNGVALVSEAWAGMSRPMVAGVIGTAANVGLFLMNTLGSYCAITADQWRWTMLVASAPIVLAIVTWLFVPESPKWRAAQGEPTDAPRPPSMHWEIFRPPLLKVALVGITIATVPQIGGWGSSNWMTPWAEEAGQALDPPNPFLKARVGQARALTGMVGSLIGGWIASHFGRRKTYFFTSLAALLAAQYIYWMLTPTDATFLWWVAALGFFSGIFFGWLPLCLPELFDTRVRSTGAGVSFNFARILTAVTVFAAGTLKSVFHGDYARIGQITSLIYALGLICIWLAPDTSERRLDE